MNQKDLIERTKKFAHRCIKLAVTLKSNVLEKHIQNQLIRCSTSVAANYRAACLAHSKNSFTSKLSIVIEECDESCFWLELIIDENIIKDNLVEPLLNEAKELTAIFIAARKTIQLNNK